MKKVDEEPKNFTEAVDRLAAAHNELKCLVAHELIQDAASVLSWFGLSRAAQKVLAMDTYKKPPDNI